MDVSSAPLVQQSWVAEPAALRRATAARTLLCWAQEVSVTNPFAARKWNPYLVGVGIGVLSWLSFLTMDRSLGTSSSFVHVAGLLVGLVSPSHVTGAGASAYYAKEVSEKTPMFDWQMFLVLGVFLGAWVSSRTSGDREREAVPGLWAWRFGANPALRYAAAFAFGAVMLFGARLAGGCTSGHGISGGLQFALSSWVFFATFFASGIATAFALFGSEGRRHVRD
jgi:uncharacterized membrane protein YedE/YeeE